MTAAKIKRLLFLGRKATTSLDSILKSRDITLPKFATSQSCGFSSNHVWMWEMDDKESWAQKNCCFWTVVLEKTLESPLDYKEIQRVNPKGNEPWIFIRRTDAEAEAPIVGPPDENSWLIGKDPDSGKDWRQKEKRTTEDEMVCQFFTWSGKSFGVSASTSVLPMNTQDWSPLGWTGWISLLSKRLSRVFSNTTVQKHQFFGTQLSLWSNSHIHTWLLEKT